MVGPLPFCRRSPPQTHNAHKSGTRDEKFDIPPPERVPSEAAINQRNPASTSARLSPLLFLDPHEHDFESDKMSEAPKDAPFQAVQIDALVSGKLAMPHLAMLSMKVKLQD